MSEKAKSKENTSTETERVPRDDEKMECDENSDVRERTEPASNDDRSNRRVREKMNQVFNNELILSEIIKRMPVKDRINAKSVSSVFLRELNRRKFLREEFIAFRENFTSERVNELVRLGLLDRDCINLAFINVESFRDQPEEFWQRYRSKVQKVRFKGCGINFQLLRQIWKNSYPNLPEISVVGCFFDDESGWETKTTENDPLDSICRSTEPSNPKKSRGKLLFQKNVEEYVCRFVIHSSNMFVYSDQGKVYSFVFEYPYRRLYIAFHGWKVEDVTLYSDFQLDASPNKLPGWSSFRSYLKTEIVDESSNPRWITIEIKKMKHLAIQSNVDPPFLAYLRDAFRR